MSVTRVFWAALPLWLLAAADLQGAQREVLVAIRADDKPGTGTAADPFNGKGPDQLDRLFRKFREEYGDNLSITFGPGTYYGTALAATKSDWTIRGAGIDKTVFKTAANPESRSTFGFRGPPCERFRLSDVTFDFNIAELRKANRAYLWHYAGQPVVRYFHAEDVPRWEKRKDYYVRQVRRRYQNVACYDGVEYIQIKADPQHDPPGDNFTKWRRLWPTDWHKLPPWQEGRASRPGDAVRWQDAGYICLADVQQRDPAPSASRDWARIDPAAPDPSIHPHAAFVRALPPGGGHIVERVKAIHTHGSRVHDREDFVIGLGGDNCLIRDCIIDRVHGDYATEIVVFQGAGSRVTGCKVYSNGANFAYGGWGCYDTVFDHNYAENVCSGVNIDSLTNRNVVFRHNTFKQCARLGLLVNVSGRAYTDRLAKQTMLYKGETVGLGRMEMDGLLIEDNHIEVLDGAPFGAVQVQAKGLKNVVVRGNRLSKTAGDKGAVAVGVSQAQHVQVVDNVCGPGMTLKNESPSCTFQGNRTTEGAAVPVWKPVLWCRARIDVRGDVRLRITGRQSVGVMMRHPPWMKGDEKLKALWTLSSDLGEEWRTMRIHFIPEGDGTVAIFLMGRYQRKNNDTDQYEPLWACFDRIEAEGAAIRNPDFEQADGNHPKHWSGPGEYVRSAERAASGSGYVCGWLRAAVTQHGVQVKAGQPVTLTAKVRAAGVADFSLKTKVQQ